MVRVLVLPGVGTESNDGVVSRGGWEVSPEPSNPETGYRSTCAAAVAGIPSGPQGPHDTTGRFPFFP
jgi:hypothetical protein